jgi:hypothetical protein
MKKRDLIDDEIQKSWPYIEKNGWVKFFEKSTYLSIPWRLYREKFDEFFNAFSKLNIDDLEELRESLIYSPFRLIIKLLQSNFDEYYTKKKIIIKKRKIGDFKDENGRQKYLIDRTFGEETKKYNAKEFEIKSTINTFFMLSHDFLIPAFNFLMLKGKKDSEKLKKYMGKKIDDDTKRAYIEIARLTIQEDLSVAQASRKLLMKLGKQIKPSAYYKYRKQHFKEFNLIIDGLKKGEPPEILTSYLK